VTEAKRVLMVGDHATSATSRESSVLKQRQGGAAPAPAPLSAFAFHSFTLQSALAVRMAAWEKGDKRTLLMGPVCAATVSMYCSLYSVEQRARVPSSVPTQ
jgi:hypothetical protein